MSSTSSRFAGFAVRESSVHAWATSTKTRPRTRPHEITRRVASLVQTLSLFTADGLEVRNVCGLETLAHYPWQRPLYLWRGEGGYAGLAKHLLVTIPYAMPGFLFAPVARSWSAPTRTNPWPRDMAQNNVALLAHLGTGGSMKEAVAARLLPANMTRRMQHALLTINEEMSLQSAICAAQVQVLGGQPWLGPALIQTRLGAAEEPEEETARLELLRWLCRHSERIPRDRVGELVDWWLPMRPGQRRAALRLPLSEGLKAAHAWHQQPAFRRYHVSGPLPQSELKGLRLDQEDGVWELKEMRRAEQLVEEGAALRHCVATYYSAVMRRTSVIFGLRQDGVRRLTVEVRPAQSAVVQARGLRNRAPFPHERRVLERWAQENSLRIQST